MVGGRRGQVIGEDLRRITEAESVERLAQAERNVEGIWECWWDYRGRRATGCGGQVRVVGMGLRANFFLFAPLCPAILEPNLEQKRNGSSMLSGIRWKRLN